MLFSVLFGQQQVQYNAGLLSSMPISYICHLHWLTGLLACWLSQTMPQLLPCFTILVALDSSLCSMSWTIFFLIFFLFKAYFAFSEGAFWRAVSIYVVISSSLKSLSQFPVLLFKNTTKPVTADVRPELEICVQLSKISLCDQISRWTGWCLLHYWFRWFGKFATMNAFLTCLLMRMAREMHISHRQRVVC